MEHPAILHPCHFLERLGASLTYLPVDGFGRVDPDDVRRAITPHTALISVMHANNEVGTLQPVAEISKIAREHGILFHTDAAQSAGRIGVRVRELGVDLLSFAGHKLYGPKGMGVLYVREGVRLEPLLHGAGHECGRRAGTEDVLLDVGLGAVARMEGVAASTGSACHAGSVELSPVLQAMNIPPEIGMGAIRFSLGRTTTREEIEVTVSRLTDALAV